jgi:hypothetical protein
MIEIIGDLLICLFIEFLNICHYKRFTLCFSVISVSMVIFTTKTRKNAEDKTEYLNRCYLYVKFGFGFKELGHLVIHFKAVVHGQ